MFMFVLLCFKFSSSLSLPKCNVVFHFLQPVPQCHKQPVYFHHSSLWIYTNSSRNHPTWWWLQFLTPDRIQWRQKIFGKNWKADKDSRGKKKKAQYPSPAGQMVVGALVDLQMSCCSNVTVTRILSEHLGSSIQHVTMPTARMKLMNQRIFSR